MNSVRFLHAGEAVRACGVLLFLYSQLANGQAILPIREFEGLWFDQTSNRAWVLNGRVANAYSATQRDSAPLAELLVDFGNANEALKSARNVTVTIDAAGAPQLAFFTAAGWKVTLAKKGGGQLDGEIGGPSGERYPVQLKRSGLAELHGWLATNPRPKARARRDSTIELLYVSAADCVFCRKWEAQYLENGRPKSSLGWRDVRLSVVDIGSYKGRFRLQHAPEHLQPAVQRLFADRERAWLAGTPTYLLFVNAELRSYAFGTTSFDTLIHPALRAALKEKSTDAVSE